MFKLFVLEFNFVVDSLRVPVVKSALFSVVTLCMECDGPNSAGQFEFISNLPVGGEDADAPCSRDRGVCFI